MWVFSKNAENGLRSLQKDLVGISKGQGVKFGYAGLLKIAVVCGVAGMSLFLGAFLMQHFLGLWF